MWLFMIASLTATLRLRVTRCRYAASNAGFQWLRPQLRQQRMRRRIAFAVMQAAETPRVVEAQRPVRIQLQVEVVVFLPRGGIRQHPQAARHPEVQQQIAPLQIHQQVFRAPPHAAHGLTLRPARQVRRATRPAQPRLVHAPRARSGGQSDGVRCRDTWSRLREVQAWASIMPAGVSRHSIQPNVSAKQKTRRWRVFCGLKQPALAAYLILVSLYFTCLRTTGSYLLSSIFSG